MGCLFFAASLLVRFFGQAKKRTKLIKKTFLYPPSFVCPKEGARKGHPLSRPFGLSEVYTPWGVLLVVGGT
jgi:hypothetical protein